MEQNSRNNPALPGSIDEKNNEFLLKVKALAKSREDLKKETILLKEKIKRLESDNHRMKQEQAHKAESGAAANDRVAELQAILAKSRARNRDLEDALERMEKRRDRELEEAKEEEINCQRKIEKKTEEMERMLLRHAEEKKDILAKSHEMEALLLKQEQEKQKLAEALIKATEERDSHLDKTVKLSTKILDLELDIREHEEKYKRLEAMILHQKRKNRSLEEDYARAVKTLDDFERQYADWEALMTAEHLQKVNSASNLPAVSQKRMELENKFGEYHAMLSGLDQEAQEKQEIIEELASDVMGAYEQKEINPVDNKPKASPAVNANIINMRRELQEMLSEVKRTIGVTANGKENGKADGGGKQ